MEIIARISLIPHLTPSGTVLWGTGVTKAQCCPPPSGSVPYLVHRIVILHKIPYFRTFVFYYSSTIKLFSGCSFALRILTCAIFRILTICSVRRKYNYNTYPHKSTLKCSSNVVLIWWEKTKLKMTTFKRERPLVDSYFGPTKTACKFIYNLSASCFGNHQLFTLHVL